ncbi:MAG: DDE-type integrase/transposase/recombinase [Chloroflexi bacterium]|jgi:putative transposase|nr:DDE-type integrase/transposase/recombinase [Chloroflexota bacterium]
MSAQRFSTGKQFVWQDVIYEVKRLLPDNLLIIEDVQTTERQSVPFAELAQALFEGELHFVAEPSAAPAVRTGQQATLADYPPHLRALANYRLEVIRPLLALGSAERTRAQVAARVAEIKQARQAGATFPTAAISIASIYRWIKAYERSGNDIRALVGNSQQQGGKDQSRLTEEAEAIIDAVIQDRYYVAEKVTCDDIYLEVALRIAEENRFRHAEEKLTPPSRATVWRRIDALDELDKLMAKRGKRSAKRQLTQYGKLDYPRIPLERVEIDHTPMDIIVVDSHDNLPLGRPTLTYCLDTTTRYPLGFYVGFEPPSYLTVMECLHHAILTKPQVRATYGTQHEWIAYGIPFALIVDNGKEFIGTDIQDACYSLGIELLQMPIKTPHFKASVERMFRTLNTGLLHTLPGTTFSNPQQRGDYNSAAEACIDLEDLYHVFHIFLVDVYAESFHRGLGDIPARRWEAITQAGFFPRLPASADELKILLGRMTYRVIQPYGIEFMRLRYNAQDLAPLRTYLEDAKAKIKYDPTDLGRIHVYDPRDQTYISVRCLDSEYAQGLSLWKHRVILNLARQQEAQVDILGLARAKRQIQEIVAQSKADKKIKRRARIARWQTGEPSTDNAPPDSEAADPSAPSALSIPVLDFSVTLDNLEDEDWSADYDLPHSSCSDGLR